MACSHPVLYDINGKTICHICGADLTVTKPAKKAPAPAKQDEPKEKIS